MAVRRRSLFQVCVMASRTRGLLRPLQAIVLAQRQIGGKSNKISAFAPLLDSIDITGAVITADALHAQHDHATYLHQRGAHYLAVVERNHPGLHNRVRRLPGVTSAWINRAHPGPPP
ncbi:transposase [Streptomyces chilikensis]|uniref:transposase n=1 Tax=Streptomyces chilikensis TaxID=1194079 RepID=UPI003B849DC1